MVMRSRKNDRLFILTKEPRALRVATTNPLKMTQPLCFDFSQHRSLTEIKDFLSHEKNDPYKPWNSWGHHTDTSMDTPSQ